MEISNKIYGGKALSQEERDEILAERRKKLDHMKKIIADPGFKNVRSSWARGYRGRNSSPEAVPYKGKYGEGYKILHPNNSRSNQYHEVEYLIGNPDENFTEETNG